MAFNPGALIDIPAGLGGGSGDNGGTIAPPTIQTPTQLPGGTIKNIPTQDPYAPGGQYYNPQPTEEPKTETETETKTEEDTSSEIPAYLIQYYKNLPAWMKKSLYDQSTGARREQFEREGIYIPPESEEKTPIIAPVLTGTPELLTGGIFGINPLKKGTDLGGIDAGLEIEKKAQQEKDEAQKKASIRTKIADFIHKLAQVGLNLSPDFWPAVLLSAGLSGLEKLVRGNREKGVEDTEGMTAEEMQKYYEAAYNWYEKAAQTGNVQHELEKINGLDRSSYSGKTEQGYSAGLEGGNTTGVTPVTYTPREETPEETPEKTIDKQSELVAKYKEEAQKALADYQKAMKETQEKYAGSYGANVEKATEQARKLSATEASLAKAQQQATLRNAGISTNAASILASQNVVNNFLSVFNKNYSESFTANEQRSLKEFENEVNSDIEILRQNRDILNQEIEFNGQLITLQNILNELEIRQQQFAIAMEQYQTAKTETEKAEKWQRVTEVGKLLAELTKGWLKTKSGNETGASNLPNGMYLVGEAGPEIVAIPEGSSVVPASVTEKIVTSDRPEKAMKEFFSEHTLIDKAQFPIDNSIMKTIGMLENFIKSNKPKDWNSLKECKSKEGDYKESFNRLKELLK